MFAIQENMKSRGIFLRDFGEPNSSPERHAEFLDFSKTNDQYILKVHGHDVVKYHESVSASIKNKNCSIVSIRRKNLLNQITSHYIEHFRLIWLYHAAGIYPLDVIPLDDEIAPNIINFILKCNRRSDELLATCHVDLNLYYEDISFIQARSIITPKPTNHTELKVFINSHIEKYFILKNTPNDLST